MISTIQIFEYLLALKNLTVPVARDVQEYNDKYWWQKDLPIDKGCILDLTHDSDVWMEVYKQVIEPSPEIPHEIKEWVKQRGIEPDNPPDIHNYLCMLSIQEKEDLVKVRKRVQELEDQLCKIEKVEQKINLEKSLVAAKQRLEFLNAREKVPFEADLRRVTIWENWLLSKWQPWAKDTLPKIKVQRLYGELFALYQRLQREGDATELVWGHGLLAWNIKGMKVFRPILTTRVELSFDSKKGVFKLTSTSQGTILELDMLSNIDLPNASHLISLEHMIQDTGINPWESALVEPFLQELAHTLSPTGRVDFEIVSGRGVGVSTDPVIYNAPVIFLRSRSGRQWHTELQSIIEQIRAGHEVPSTIQSLVSVDLANEKGADKDKQERENLLWKPLGEELLFPLPSNEDQKEIAYRLSRNIGVVVQGPPGTGKSHTIANLIAHLLAHGKRVLVTSQTERALRVLGEMIRSKLPEIAPLCVSVAGGDARSVQELDLSVSRISEGLDQMNIHFLSKEIEQLRFQLFECKKKIASIKTELSKAMESEHIVVNVAGMEFTPLQLAGWLTSNEENYGWFPDELGETDAIPLNEAELIKLFSLTCELSKKDIDSVNQHRPNIDDLPTAESIVSSYIKLKNLKDNCKREEALKGWSFSNNAPAKVSEALRTTDKAVATLNLLSEQWLVRILEEVVHGDNRGLYWQELVTNFKERIRSIRDKENNIIEFEVVIPTSVDLRQLKDDAETLREELIKNSKPGFMFKMFSGKRTLYILEQVKINGSNLRTAEDTDILLQQIEIKELLKRLIQKWNNSLNSIEGPIVEESTQRVLQTLERNIEQIQVAFEWKHNYLNSLLNLSAEIKPYGVLDWTNVGWLKTYREGLEIYSEKLEYNRRSKLFEDYSTALKRGMNCENVHISWAELYEAYRLGDGVKWRKTLQELRRIRLLEPKVKEYTELATRLSQYAPRWMAQIEVEVRADIRKEPPEDWQKAWEWKRANTWLNSHFAKVKLEELYEEWNNKREQESRLIQLLVSKSTWLEQIKRTTDAQRRSLRSWVQTIRRIGKGKGKYAAKHYADAKKEMAVCRGAVPVWIMPLNRVIENFKPSDDKFDVVIVDESSQCDLFSLSALFRAKRAVIVGDDRQISPEGVGKDQTEVYNLIERYLIGVPQRERFTLQDSLYDTALRVFPGQQIMLKEHFRCIPEIIQFSNDLFYGGTIEPLRVPTSDRLTPPVIAVRVNDGFREEGTAAVNEPEAIALVDKIVELCGKTEYANKSMGVISLQGKDQAYVIEQYLRDKIGESEMEDRRLICGDSYSFQGDERDIILLSLVAAPNVRPGVLNKRSDEQRFNVAASRAKEQLWLFHSVDLKDLNPNCMRYRLLQYCLDPHRTQCEMESAEELFRRYGSSKFHREVHNLIVARGFRAIPEFKVGTHPYRIDTVIEGINGRLAVECDGDEWHGRDRWEADLERQMILERVGWKFWRVRGSTFYRNKQKAMDSLWKVLADMGIEPARN